ncbi:cytochrome-c peroxidase [Magnetococcus sp. PR-3]|uniref:cytochrome-c peroxidase n=1 Tax=Magnetococcus sp. PR-3 TaxID=3120355 RepID=UPI002FCE1B0F
MPLFSNPVTTILWLVAILGLFILWHLSRELSRNWKPTRGIWLAGAIGLGLVALSFKAALMNLLIDNLDHFSQWGQPQRTTVEPVQPTGPGGAGPWVALPLSPPHPMDNPTNRVKEALGQRLFYDSALSKDGTIACVSCHDLANGGDDGQQRSQGIGGALGGRNAPGIWNSAYLSRLFWDGRAASLEDQAQGPLLHPDEMGMDSLEQVVKRIKEIEGYPQAFDEAFKQPDALNAPNLLKALATFERTLVQANTAYDRYVRGDKQALTAAQKRGMNHFKKLGCRNCHRDPTFSAAGLVKPFGVYRRFPIHKHTELLTKYRLDQDLGKGHGRWRVPSLRNVAHTAPYFHNGSVPTLKEAVWLMGKLQLNRTLAPTTIDDLVAFLQAISHQSNDISPKLLAGAQQP